MTTAPVNDFPRKSSADCASERRKRVVASRGVMYRVAVTGSEAGVASADGLGEA